MKTLEFKKNGSVIESTKENNGIHVDFVIAPPNREEEVKRAFNAKDLKEPFPKAICNRVQHLGKQVYHETDYTRFSFLDVNREIDYHKANKFAMFSLIKGYNYFASNPCVVSEVIQPGTLILCDGQNRFVGTTLARQPVSYIIDNELTIDDITKINRYQTSWRDLQFLKSYAIQGKESYVYLNARFEEQHEMKLSSLKKIFAVPSKHIFDDGKWVLSEVIRIRGERILEIIRTDFEWYEYKDHCTFISAFLGLYRMPKYSHTRMREKLALTKDKMINTKFSDYTAGLEFLKYIYNYKIKTDVLT
jgi:hypothetical protein